jgi:diamine N-acetyltransferase
MIIGGRVRLRAMERSDLPRFQTWLNDPEVIKGLQVYLPLSDEDERKWFEQMMERPAEERPLAIEVREADNWNLVGNAVLFNIEWTNRNAGLGIFLGDKSYWNQGFGTEALALLLQHGFDTLNLHRIHLRVYATNPRARRSYEKAGFTLEGTEREALFRGGRYVDVHLMGILRSEWKGNGERR